MIKTLVSSIAHTKRLLQTANHFRRAADLGMEGGPTDHALSKAFNMAGFKAVPASIARLAALFVLSEHPTLSADAVTRRTQAYMAQWQDGALRREQAAPVGNRPLFGPSPRRT